MLEARAASEIHGQQRKEPMLPRPAQKEPCRPQQKPAQPSLEMTITDDGSSLVSAEHAGERRYKQLVQSLKDGISFAEVTHANQHESIRRVMCPFVQMPYEEELELKSAKNREAVAAVLAAARVDGKTSCKPIVPSPVRAGYRDKDEFSINVGVDGDSKTVGFFVGRPRSGLVCVPADAVDVIKAKHKTVAAAFQDYIRSSPLAVNLTPGFEDGRGDGGFWRTMLVRSNSVGDIMAVAAVHPQDLPATRIEEEKRALAAHFSGPAASCGVTSMYVDVNAHSGPPSSKCELIFGRPHIEEEVLGKRFQIGPASFFQSNSACAPALVSTVKDALSLKSNDVLIEVGCGVGVFSLLLAPYAHRVVGLDLNANAVGEAEVNAEINDVRNAEFVSGDVKHTLPYVLKGVKNRRVLAVVNPGRSGVSFWAMEQLRAHARVAKVVYVSCQPEGKAETNMRDLIKSPTQKYTYQQGHYRRSFKLVEATPVDMFPGTHCCEHVFTFQR